MCELVDALLREVEETTRLIEYEKGFAEGDRVGFQEGLQKGRKIKIGLSVKSDISLFSSNLFSTFIV